MAAFIIKKNVNPKINSTPKSIYRRESVYDCSPPYIRNKLDDSYAFMAFHEDFVTIIANGTPKSHTNTQIAIHKHTRLKVGYLYVKDLAIIKMMVILKSREMVAAIM